MNWIQPMEPVSCTEIKEGPEYIHEVKWDGIRGLVYVEGKRLKLYTKKGNDRTDFYPELGFLNSELGNIDVILDGEMVVLDANSLPSFHNVLVRETVKSRKNLQYYLNNYPVKYMVFDILYYKDRPLTRLPLSERKQILRRLLDPVANQSSVVGLSEMYFDGKELYRKMKQNNMEGIVSKKINSSYIEGKKHDAWFKTKFTKKMLCIIGGIQWKEEKPNSLVLGVKTTESEKLYYVGKASLGLKESDLRLLKEYRNEISQDECPFEMKSIANIDITGTELTWVSPLITCWISFLELSDDGHFRHPKIIGFSDMSAAKADGKVLTD